MRTCKDDEYLSKLHVNCLHHVLPHTHATQQVEACIEKPHTWHPLDEMRIFEVHTVCSDPWSTLISLERHRKRPSAGYDMAIKIKAAVGLGTV